MALNTESWISDIQELMKMDSPFLSHVKNHDSEIVKNTIHIPQSGSIVGIQVNRNTFPATVDRRVDTDLTYQTKQYTTNPVLVPDIETFQISYDKRQSVMGEHLSALVERVGNDALLTYATGTTTIATSGTLADVKPVGATGQRKAVTHTDIAKLANALDKQGVAKTGRKLLMNTDMFYQLLENDNVLKAAYNGFSNSVIADGIVAKLYGFDIMVRPFVAIYNGSTAKDFAAASAAADNLACLAWHPDYLAKAEGSTKVLYKENDPEFYGNIMSVIKWAGYTKMRSDNKGVVALVQSA